MGYYFKPEKRRGLAEDLGPTITAGEYVSTLASVIRTLPHTLIESGPRYQLGVVYLKGALLGQALRTLAALVQERPDDPSAHRLLALAYLCHGDFRDAARHLETGLRLLRRGDPVTIGLDNALRVQMEQALIRLLLVPLYKRLGQVEAARFLAVEGQGP